MQDRNEKKARPLPETFACELCAQKLRAGGREMWEASETVMGYCQYGFHTTAGKWYEYRTREARAAERRRRAREQYGQRRPSGGGERARASWGDV